MPAPTPLPVRQAILRRQQLGQSVAAIAQALRLPRRTVRQLLQRYRLQGDPALPPAYRHDAPPRSPPLQRLFDQALALRRDHPTWGAGLIRLRLAAPDRRASLPCERTLQRWFGAAGLGPAPKGRRPASQSTAAPTNPTWSGKWTPPN